jgi:hypothetical protein
VVALAVSTLIGTFQMCRYNKIYNHQKEIFQKDDNISKKTDKERIEKPDRLVICSVLAGTVPVFGVCPGIPDFHQTVPV